MPVRAMKVVEKQAHPNTDKLFVYRFEAPGIGSKTVVANLTNVYEVGQVAAVAQIGTFLPEGEIKPRKVFGVASEGMALGVVDAEPGADLTEAFGADAPVRKWSLRFSIEVEGRYPADAERAARKALKGGAGRLEQAEVQE